MCELLGVGSVCLTLRIVVESIMAPLNFLHDKIAFLNPGLKLSALQTNRGLRASIHTDAYNPALGPCVGGQLWTCTSDGGDL